MALFYASRLYAYAVLADNIDVIDDRADKSIKLFQEITT